MHLQIQRTLYLSLGVVMVVMVDFLITGKPLGIVDKPLTFKSKVKSSGYSEQPRSDIT